MKVISSRILIDTSVLIDLLRGNISDSIWLKTLEGRAPSVSPITVHELRRGVAPNSKWEQQIDQLLPRESILTAPPITEDWIEAADVIRIYFGKSRSKIELAALAHDVLIGLTARAMKAELWSRDKDFKVICAAVKISLLDH